MASNSDKHTGSPVLSSPPASPEPPAPPAPQWITAAQGASSLILSNVDGFVKALDAFVKKADNGTSSDPLGAVLDFALFAFKSGVKLSLKTIFGFYNFVEGALREGGGKGGIGSGAAPEAQAVGDKDKVGTNIEADDVSQKKDKDAGLVLRRKDESVQSQGAPILSEKAKDTERTIENGDGGGKNALGAPPPPAVFRAESGNIKNQNFGVAQKIQELSSANEKNVASQQSRETTSILSVRGR